MGGNTKTCVILCLSPTMEQLDHSLQTLKFGCNVNKIENRVGKNVTKTNSDETLKFLIQEYQAKLEALSNIQSSDANEIKAENDLLWQQFVMNDESKKMVKVPKEISKGRILMQFYVDESVYCENEPKTDDKLIKTLIEAIKVSCKHTFYWKSKAQNYEKEFSKMKDEIVARNVYISKLLEVTEDCLKTLKSQVAKTEIYEHTEKWAQQLSSKGLNSLMSHFKMKLQQIQDLIAIPNTTKNAQPKLDLKLKHNESYIGNLIKDGKSIVNSSLQSDIACERPIPTNEFDKKLLFLIESIKNSLQTTSKETIATIHMKDTKPEIELSRTPRHNSRKNTILSKPRTPNIRKLKLDYGVSRKRVEKLESRSTSSNSRQYTSRNKRGKELAKLGTMINKAIKVVNSQKSTPRSNTSNELSNGTQSQNEKFISEIYEMGAFSHIQSPQQLKKSLKQSVRTEYDEENNENTGEILQAWQKLIGSIGLK